MKCFKCGHENEKGAKFCSNCGKSFQPKNTQNQNYKNEQNSYPDPKAVEAYENHLMQKSNKASSVWIWYVILLIPAFIFSGGNLVIFGVIAFFGLFVAQSAVNATKVMREEDYYAIPTTKDSNGEHRCIFCGNKGLYKSTQYRTTTTKNACSKCKKFLFFGRQS